ncbi:(2Fe-2S)-binding protein [Virgibacillus byunsanensis]|uniref:(2Fe-2S)-binding protein n=1 Tax=Virgibacillus byunsanensis TaxID=570945 RepID=A0ABW3LQN1_9BACI
MRIYEHPILGPLDRRTITISFDGVDYPALEGESIAAALLANEIRILRYSEKQKKPRGIYCGIGHCYECRVTVDGKSGIRSCISQVTDKMRIKSKSDYSL